MTKRIRTTGLRLKGRSFGQHPKDGPVKHIRIRRSRAKKPEAEAGSDTRPPSYPAKD
jgi:hypothetical protein